MEQGERRLSRKNVNKRKNAILISISMVVFVLSFVSTLQVRSVYARSQATSPELQRIEDLQQALTQEQEKSANLSDQLKQKESDINVLKSYDDNQVLKMLDGQLKKVELWAGLTQVIGNGVVVTLNDSTLTLPEGASNPNQYLVHDYDVLQVVNVLFNGGAEAVSVNGERIVANTSIFCVGTAILVNDRRLGPPYVIKAIGDPEIMTASLKIREGVYEIKKDYIQFAIESKTDIIINPYQGSQDYQYAKTVGEGDTK